MHDKIQHLSKSWNVPGFLISSLHSFVTNGLPTIPAGVDQSLIPPNLVDRVNFIVNLRWVENPDAINTALLDLKNQLSKGKIVRNQVGFIVSCARRYKEIEKQPLPDGVNEKLIPTDQLRDLKLRDYLIRVCLLYSFSAILTHPSSR